MYDTENPKKKRKRIQFLTFKLFTNFFKLPKNYIRVFGYPREVKLICSKLCEP